MWPGLDAVRVQADGSAYSTVLGIHAPTTSPPNQGAQRNRPTQHRKICIYLGVRQDQLEHRQTVDAVRVQSDHVAPVRGQLDIGLRQDVHGEVLIAGIKEPQ